MNGRLLLPSIAIALLAPAEIVAWPCDPTENVPVCTDASFQWFPDIAQDGFGGAFVTWQDFRAGNYDIYVHHVLNLGLTDIAWPHDGRVLCTDAANQEYPAIIADGTGGAIVTWSDWRSTDLDVYAQRVDSNGIPQWTPDGIAVCDTTGHQFGGGIVSDGAGGAIIAWTDERADSLTGDIYALRILASGVPDPAWPANGRALCAETHDQMDPVLVADGAGGAIVAWSDGRFPATAMDVYAQRVSASGVPLWTPDGVVVCAASLNQFATGVVSDGSGGALFTWRDFRTGDGNIYVQHILASGAPDLSWPTNGSALCTAPNHQESPVIASDGAGGAIVAWVDLRNGTVDRLYVRRVSATGIPQWAPDGVALSTAAGPQDLANIVSDGSGGAVISWSQEMIYPNHDVYAQRIDASGSVLWAAEGVAVSSAGGEQRPYYLASDGSGGIISAWDDGRSLSSHDIYVQRVTAGGHLDDRFEDNDSCPVLAVQPFGTTLQLAVHFDDEDWSAVLVDRSESLTVEVAFTHANGDVDLGLWSDCFTGAAFSVGVTDLETISYTNLGPQNLFYSQVYLAVGMCNTYEMTLSVDPTSNITALTPPGWTAPAVPRNLGNAQPSSVSLTPTLDGNAFATWLNWTATNEGPHYLPAWECEIQIDGVPHVALGIPDDNPPGTYSQINFGPIEVRGGRHSLTVVADPADVVSETDELDNDWSGQWVWSPLDVAWEAPVLRPVPPDPGLMIYPNSDGMSFTRDPSYAWVTSLAALAPDDDYDLVVYQDYSGSTSGFTNVLAESDRAWNFTDFVVGHWFGTPSTVYPAAVLWDAAGGGNEFAADQSDARNRNVNLTTEPGASWPAQELAPLRLADIYEAYLEAGTTYHFYLRRTAGIADLSFELFPGTSGGIYRRGQGDEASAFGGLHSLDFAATETGWHPIVVLRDRGTDAGAPVEYDFLASTEILVDAPVAAPKWELAFLGAAPNPIRDAGQFRFVLPNAGPASLVLYDVTGRRVRTLANGSWSAGPQTVAWDGCDEAGSRLAAGVYWARFEGEGTTITRRVTVLR